MLRSNIRDMESSSDCLRHNIYHLHVPLFILDVIRLFQDHPKYLRGLKEIHIVELLQKEAFACGDVEAQVKMAINELITSGFVRYIGQGYRTLGPFAKLALARTSRQYNIAWERLNKMQQICGASFSSSSTSFTNS